MREEFMRSHNAFENSMVGNFAANRHIMLYEIAEFLKSNGIDLGSLVNILLRGNFLLDLDFGDVEMEFEIGVPDFALTDIDNDETLITISIQFRKESSETRRLNYTYKAKELKKMAKAK